MLLLALAFGLTALLTAAAQAATSRVQVTLRPGTQTVSVRRGQPLLLVNGDIRPHRLVEPNIRLDRPGQAHEVRFREPGDYVLHTYAGPSLVPWLTDLPRAGATLRITVR